MDPDFSAENPTEPEDENYFISLGDLMTGVVFIFVILLCAFAFDYKSAQTLAQQAESKAAEAAATNDRIGEDNRRKGNQISALTGLLADRDQKLISLLRDFVKNLQASGLRVELDEANGVVHLPEEMLFESGSADFSPHAKVSLGIFAATLDPLLGRICAEGSPFHLEAVFIEGHTDDHPIHTSEFRDNWDLSTARATRTFRTLIAARGTLEKYLNPNHLPLLGVSGYGENRPVVDNKQESLRPKNRRIDLRFLVAYPSKDELAHLDEVLRRSREP